MTTYACAHNRHGECLGMVLVDPPRDLRDKKPCDCACHTEEGER